MKTAIALLLAVSVIFMAGCGTQQPDHSFLIEVYSGKAQEYIDAGDLDNAIAILEEGIAATDGADALEQMLDGLAQQAPPSLCCQNCGKEIDAEAKFCGSCGASVQDSTAVAGKDLMSDLSDQERADLNRFLMTFVGNGFHPQLDAFSDYDMVRLVFSVCSYGEEMTYTDGKPYDYNFTVSSEIAEKYVYRLFGTELQHPDAETELGDSLYYTPDGFYHVPASDGEMRMDICVLNKLSLNENGRYDAEFQLYTMSPEVYYDDPDMEVYYALTAEAAAQRPELTASGTVTAEIGRHDAGSTETGYYLCSYRSAP